MPSGQFCCSMFEGPRVDGYVSVCAHVCVYMCVCTIIRKVEEVCLHELFSLDKVRAPPSSTVAGAPIVAGDRQEKAGVRDQVRSQGGHELAQNRK